MTDLYSNSIIRNIYKRPSSNSEVSSQIIYGEKFKIIENKKNWIKIKTTNDKYTGYIKKEKIKKKLKIIFKTYKLKTRIFSKDRGNMFLSFNSRLPVINKNKNFIEFERGKWIKKRDVKPINHKEKDFVKIFNYFINCRYLWGGKSYRGIDCSALVQLFYQYNNIFFPRDTKDQVKFKRGKNKVIKFKKGDIIYWKGHVAICLNKNKLIHAYGPKKKVVIMDINETIKLIRETAKLQVKKVTRI